ncbi:stage II sporulation protein M [Lapillicoccus jejuensis]|uniref:Putative membrane protein SpoIIM required for sporulation n=1 Tax=Lapillicoccus jejuensis TaxID=402171 RepID=A0A542E2C5_9MICO|nr:stage II sporulation protein M [Lapillicoccus jejuensis]TQJ09429.1 putative membrane protein SpoIIM required for sporulation [Lapillicoccus jejuensis]
MDLDAYVTAHHGEWSRLEQLSGQRRLSGTEADEMLDLYQRVATHLSEVRTRSPEPTLVAHLSSLLARARLRSAGTRTFTWSDVVRFLTVTFPAALFHTRRWWLTTLGVNVAAAFVMGWYLVAHPALETSLLSPSEVQQLVDNDFAGYYTQYAAGSFAVKIWTNNAWVTALCLALGVFGVPVVYLLFQNVVNVAVIGGIMWTHGRADLFFGLILPHGMLELTCVFVAAGAGLRIFWAWIEPGPRTRGQAVAEEGRAALSLALGLALVLLVTGLIEAFVTPSPLPTWARIGVGVLAELAFLTYVFTLGRWAARRGETGDLVPADRGETAPVV